MAGYGARRFGASRAGTLGGILGGIVGALLGSTIFGVGAILGLPVGAVVGVYLAESRSARRREKSEILNERSVGKSVKGVFAGYLFSALVEVALGTIATLIFVFTAWP
ncbi:MAG: DUF456 family protein [Acidimicrobiia bacterium]|nr:DUF456 family protein [Acidimicrobiia bacterium]